MKLKLTKDGHAVVKDGKPVYVHTNGREEAFDAPAAWKLALGKHFETSPVMAGLKLPADVAASFFGDSFRIEGGKLVAVDGHGIQLYSPTRHGEAANFDEAFGQMVDQYHAKEMILKKDSQAGAAPGQKSDGSTITRAEFDVMPQDTRAKFFRGGGRISDALSSPTTAPAPAPSNGEKVITRSQFDAMPPLQAAHFVKAGGTLVD